MPIAAQTSKAGGSGRAPENTRITTEAMERRPLTPQEDTVQTFEAVVLPHLDAACNLARWLTRNEQDAEDIVHEACLRALRFFPGFRDVDARAWLMKIVRNTCYSWLRANRPRHDAAAFDENLFPSDLHGLHPEEVMLRNRNRTLVREALEKVPTNFREVLILREFEGMSYKDIAEITDTPIGAVGSSLSRARGLLRQVLMGL